MNNNSRHNQGFGVLSPNHPSKPHDWFPTNEAALLRVHLEDIWKDMGLLNDLRLKSRSENSTYDRLLFKYMMMEFHSLIPAVQRLQTIIMTHNSIGPGDPVPPRYVTTIEQRKAKAQFKKFFTAINQVSTDLKVIRNTITAHRDQQDWQVIKETWEKIDAERFLPVINAFAPLFDFVSNLNIYNWSRNLGDDSMAILGGRIHVTNFSEES